MLCLESRVGHASRGIVSLLRLRSRMRNTMGHFSSNPSPPSTGRRPTSSQRHHCSATLSACFSMATDALFVSSRMTPKATVTLSLSLNSDERCPLSIPIFSTFKCFRSSNVFIDRYYTCIIPHHNRDTELSVNGQSVVPTSQGVKEEYRRLSWINLKTKQNTWTPEMYVITVHTPHAV